MGACVFLGGMGVGVCKVPNLGVSLHCFLSSLPHQASLEKHLLQWKVCGMGFIWGWFAILAEIC